jgi:hypothetical protein
VGVLVGTISLLPVNLSAQGAIDSSALRAVFGPPTRKLEAPPGEVFAVLPGVEMTVTYAKSGTVVCKLEIPSHRASKKQVERILDRALPVSTRGKKGNELLDMSGGSGFHSTYYERLIILIDNYTRDVLDKRPGATVIFKSSACGWKPGTDVMDIWPTPSQRR